MSRTPKIVVEISNDVTYCDRSHTRAGDVFVYVNHAVYGGPMTAMTLKQYNEMVKGDLPADYVAAVLDDQNSKHVARKHERVRKVGTWRFITDGDKPVRIDPVILPCVDPLERLLASSVNGLTGKQCLELFESGMQEERNSGLNGDQVKLARRCWAATLKRKASDTQEKERMRVVVDLDW